MFLRYGVNHVLPRVKNIYNVFYSKFFIWNSESATGVNLIAAIIHNMPKKIWTTI